MRRLFNPITLFVTLTTVTLVSTAVSAKGPAATKSRNAASAVAIETPPQLCDLAK